MKSKTNRILYVVIAFLCVAIVLSAVLIPLYFTGVIGKGLTPTPDPEPQPEQPKGIEFKSVSAKSMPKGQYADFTILYNEKQYTIKVYLLSDYAPKTVENFVKYAQNGLYNNTVFYRADISYDPETEEPTSAYLQGGAYVTDADGNLVRKTPDPYYGPIKGEFFANDPDTKNNISFVGGVLGMVRDESDYDSADTEFFFLPYAHAQYNGYYAAFGVTVESDDNGELYTFTKALMREEGKYPVVIKSVKVYARN